MKAHFPRRFLFALVTLSLLPCVAFGTVPDACNASSNRLTITPDGNAVYTVRLVVNSSGLLPAQIGGPICENVETIVGLADAVFHTAPIKMGLVAPCSKFVGEPDEPVGLDDAVFLTPYVKLSIPGTCEP